ncbi:protein-protein interaction regulator family protein [Tasmannia lanceolata]|uniref:protein-protein interaction regulator family protein n=1 Tax=Tasmannia lanceolata TaxID=3420 RepID=UPI0040639DCC
MGSSVVEKSAEELKKEIEELHRQQWEITERLRDPRGIRRGGLAVNGRGFGPANGVRQRGFIRPAERVEAEDEPAPKRRLSSAVVKVEDGELVEDAGDGAEDVKEDGLAAEGISAVGSENDRNSLNPQRGGFRRDNNQRAFRTPDVDVQAIEHVPRVLPKNEDPSLVKRNRRMLGQLLGTLEKFREEDQHLSTSEAFMRRSDSLRRAEQRAREESERLRQQEREQIAEKRRRDLTLRARVAAKAEEKKLELLFIRWSEHHKMLCNFLRTKAEPPIFYLPTKPLDDDVALGEQRKEQAFQQWKATRREELSEYQKHIGEQHITNVEAELERWQNARNARKVNNLMNLQETMDRELETHRLEHGPKTRKIPGGNDDEEDVEDIAGEDDMMDDVLEVDDNRRVDDTTKPEPVNTSPSPDHDAH